jgi:hypothetical protein
MVALFDLQALTLTAFKFKKYKKHFESSWILNRLVFILREVFVRGIFLSNFSVQSLEPRCPFLLPLFSVFKLVGGMIDCNVLLRKLSFLVS